MEIFLNAFVAVLIFAALFGVGYLPYVRNIIEFEHRTQFSTAWFVFSILTIFYFVDTYTIFSLENIFWKALVAVAAVIIVMAFSFQWQNTGRHLMPRNTNYTNEVVTFYDFTPRYAFVKALDIFFQNVTAAVVIYAMFFFTGSVLMTGVLFAAFFFLVHAITILLYGVEWAYILIVLSFVAGVVPVVLILLMPGGIILLFSFHYLVYALFLMALKYKARYCGGGAHAGARVCQ